MRQTIVTVTTMTMNGTCLRLSSCWLCLFGGGGEGESIYNILLWYSSIILRKNYCFIHVISEKKTLLRNNLCVLALHVDGDCDAFYRDFNCSTVIKKMHHCMCWDIKIMMLTSVLLFVVASSIVSFVSLLLF